MEALVCSFAMAMPMAKVAAMTREHDTRIGRVIPTVVRHEALLVRMEVGFLRCRAVVAVG